MLYLDFDVQIAKNKYLVKFSGSFNSTVYTFVFSHN